MATMTETIAVAIEARKNTDAIKQVVQEVKSVSTAAREAQTAVNATGGAQGAAIASVAKGAGQMQNQLKQGAQQLQAVAYAAQGAALGGKEAVAQMGNLATTLAQVSQNAKFSQMAMQLGGAITLLGTFIALAIEAKKKFSEIPEGVLSNFGQLRLGMVETTADLQRELARATAQAEALQKAVGNTGDTDGLARYTAQLKLIDELRKRGAEIAREEARRTQEEAAQRRKEAAERITEERTSYVLERERLDARSTTYSMAVAQANFDAAARARAIQGMHLEADQRKELLDLSRMQLDNDTVRAEIARTRAVEGMQRQTRTEGAENLGQQYAAREEARKAELQQMLKDSATVDEIRARSELRIRQMRRETYQQTVGYLGQLTKVMQESGSRQVKAVGHAAESIRRIMIGAEGARAAVSSLREGAAAVGSLAVGDFRGAALHGASAVQYAAAAALAAQESLGGGRTASGGGGGGGGAGTTTFVPDTGSGGQSDTVINLITKDPYGRDAIAQTMHLMRRAGALQQNVNVPPTTGFAVAMGRAS